MAVRVGTTVGFVANNRPTVVDRRGQVGVRDLAVIPAVVVFSRMIPRLRRGRPPELIEVLTLRVHGELESWTMQDVPPFDLLEPAPNTWKLLT